MMLRYCYVRGEPSYQPLDSERSAWGNFWLSGTRKTGRLLDIHVAFLLHRDSFACTPYRKIASRWPMGGRVCVSRSVAAETGPNVTSRAICFRRHIDVESRRIRHRRRLMLTAGLSTHACRFTVYWLSILLAVAVMHAWKSSADEIGEQGRAGPY